MLHSLFSRLAAVLVALLAAVAALSLLITSHSTTRYQQEVAQKLNLTLAEHIVAETRLMAGGRVDQAGLKHLFHQLMVFNPAIELYLLDPAGTILAHSAPKGRVHREAVDLGPINRFLQAPTAIPVLGDDPRGPGQTKVFSVAPVHGTNGNEGFLYIILGGEDYDSVAAMLRESYTIKQTVWVIGLSLLLSLTAGLILFHWLTRRLHKLSAAMDDFEGNAGLAGGLIAAPARGDEIDRLSASFARMTARIQEQIEQLRGTDELRRDLVANVSHDLRTPLATLQGCVETVLLKEDTLAASERQDYLSLALQHCQRLNRLVNDLFELARLDATDTLPQPEAFPLADLVQDVVQKFRLVASQRGVDMTVCARDRLPFVRADIGLVERVLENLVENALRHTDSGGSIEIALLLRGERVKVQVSDTGCGIDKNELRKIFERSYQVDKSRGTGSASTGLGLAIVKRILEVHNSAIQVRSAINKGTTFEFELPVAPPLSRVSHQRA